MIIGANQKAEVNINANLRFFCALLKCPVLLRALAFFDDKLDEIFALIRIIAKKVISHTIFHQPITKPEEYRKKSKAKPEESPLRFFFQQQQVGGDTHSHRKEQKKRTKYRFFFNFLLVKPTDRIKLAIHHTPPLKTRTCFSLNYRADNIYFIIKSVARLKADRTSELDSSRNKEI